MLRSDVTQQAQMGGVDFSNLNARSRHASRPLSRTRKWGTAARTRLELGSWGLQGQPWHKTERRAREQKTDKIGAN